MALPVVRTLTECADYFSTVAPHLDQLRAVPQVVFDSMANPAALKQVYLDTNPLLTSLAFAFAISPIFLITSEINRNYSQVDRFWSILPTIWNIHYAVYGHLAGVDTTRVDAAAAVSTLWSIRLTYNYFRRGGYSIGSEDYRWVIVKDYAGPVAFFLFNIVFISFAQVILLLSVTTPTYVLLLTGRLASNSSLTPSWTSRDTVAASVMVVAIATSFVADQQQWNFHQAKSHYKDTARVPHGYKRADLDRGFLTRGLWAYSRHPNFTAEQTVWVTLYVWSCLATGTWYNWTGIGAASYLFLFQSSTWLTELLSSQKYPDYKLYQRDVGKFLPLPGATANFPDISSHHANGSVQNEKDAAKARERYDLR